MEMLAESCWSPACIHHSTSLHFPLSSLRLICLLEFLSPQLFKKPTIFHLIFPQHSPPSFVFLPITLSSSYFALFLSCFFQPTTCLFISSAALSIFFPSPLAHLFLLTIRLSLPSNLQIVGSELSTLVSISWLINVS